MAGDKRIAHIDLSGTILQHKVSDRPVPLMPQLLRSMQENGWQVTVTSIRFSASETKLAMAAAGIDLDVEAIIAPNKGEAVKEALAANPDAEEAVVVDDRGGNLDDVLALRDKRVRAMGFIGSRKYCPQLCVRCATWGIGVALSAPDLAEALGVPLRVDPDSLELTCEEWSSLIAGLDHPFSESEAVTERFDHALPVEGLRRTCTDWWKHAWWQLGWITCAECLWKAVVASAIEAAGLNCEEVLEHPGLPDDCAERLRLAPAGKKEKLKPQFVAALELITRGLGEVGPEADKCRPRGRTVDAERVERTIARLGEVYGDVPWLKDAGWKLEETKARTLGP
jgi:hypothetical protein